MSVEGIKFTKKYRCFKAGDSIEFRPGVNLLVGDQGCGKSTVIGCIANPKEHGKGLFKLAVSKPGPLRFFDFEKHNPRKSSYMDPRLGAMGTVTMMYSSHGQAVNAILQGLKEFEEQPVLVLLDEPDMALSVRSINKLSNLLAEIAGTGVQIIASAHNPFLMKSVPEVCSLEHRRWMPWEEFVESQQTTSTF